MEAMRYFDAHAHMSWYEDPEAAMHACEAAGLGGICCTIGPDDYRGLLDAYAGRVAGTWRIAAGLHPWWVHEGMLEAAVEHARRSTFVGEVGLDFSKRHEGTKEAQLRAFEAICSAAPEGAILSIHSVSAAQTALDVLASTGALERCRCVFHWFSGTSTELDRARRAGCWFSIGERSLATRRGSEYARQVPAVRILTETDLPERPGAPVDAATHLASVQRAVAGIARARGVGEQEARALVLANSLTLLC